MHTSRLQRSPQKRSRAFSLVELLAVVGTISFLLSFTVPAIKGLTGSSGLSTGVRNLANLLNLARSEAIAQHTIVRFVVATDWPGEPDAAMRKASLWKWDPELEDFTQLTPWHQLPTGIILERDVPEYVKSASYAEADGSSVRGESVFSTDGDGSSDFTIGRGENAIRARYVDFLPSGTARVGGSLARKVIFVTVSGYAENGQLVYTAASEARPVAWGQVNLDTLTGRVQVLQP